MGYHNIPSKTRYCHTYEPDFSLQVPDRYSFGKRRAHEHPDGLVGQSVTGVAGAIIPRSDSPSFMASKERFVRKTPEWEHANGRIEGKSTLGRVQGWQQEMIVADKHASQGLSVARQKRVNRSLDQVNSTFKDHR